MAIQVPGNPFAGDVDISDTRGLRTVDAPATKYNKYSLTSGLAQNTAAAVEKWQDEISATQAKDAINQAEQIRQERANDPERGWRAATGKNALERDSGMSLVDETEAGWDQDVKDIRSKLNTKAAKLFDKYEQNARLQQRYDIQRHVLKQQGVYETAVAEQTLNTAGQMIVSDDPKTIEQGFMLAESTLKEREAKTGVPIDRSETLGPMHLVVLGNMIDAGNVAGAKKRFQAVKGQMRAEDQIKYKAALKVAESTQRVKSATQKALGDSKTLAEAFKALNAAGLDDKEMKQARSAVRQSFEDRATEQKLALNDSASRALQFVLQGTDPPASLQAEMMTSEEGVRRLNSLLSLAGKVRDRNLPKHDDPTVLRSAKALQENDPDSFYQSNLTEMYGNSLTPATIKQLEREKTTMQDPARKRFLAAVKDRATLEKVSKSNEPSLMLAAGRMYDDLAQQRTSGALSKDDIKELTDSLFMNADIPWGLDKDIYQKVAGNATAGNDLFAGFRPDISDTDLRSFAQRRLGIDVDDLTPDRRQFLSRMVAGGAYPQDLWAKGYAAALRMLRAAGRTGTPTQSEIAQIINNYMLTGAYANYWK